MKKSIACVSAVCFLLSAAQAEFRVWSSKGGSSNVEAQFIQMSGNRVVLEKRDGKRVMVPADKLCGKDQEYLASIVPPQLKIKVDKDVDTEKLDEYSGYSSSWVHKRQDISINVDIQKTNKGRCTQKFQAHLYIIAKSAKGDNRRVLDHKEKSISFVNHSAEQISGSASCKFFEYSGYSTGSERGWEYEGYLVIIEDQNGQAIASETNKSTYESKLVKIRDNLNDRNGFDL